MRRDHFLLILSLLAALSLTGVSCGSEPSGVDNSSLAEAASLALEQETFRMSARGAAPVNEQMGGGTLSFEGTGVMDTGSGLGEVTFRFTGGDGLETAAASMGSMNAVYDFDDGLIMYIDWGFLRDQLPDSKRWVRMDLQALGEEAGIDMSALMQPGQSNPMQGLDYLQGTREIEEVGTETIRGVETTHYEAVVDLDLLAEEVPETADSLRALQEVSGIQDIPTEVWVDAQGLPRRVSYTFEYDPPTDALPGTPDGTMTMTNDFFDYGIDVDVQLPPDDQVIDLEDLMGEP